MGISKKSLAFSRSPNAQIKGQLQTSYLTAPTEWKSVAEVFEAVKSKVSKLVTEEDKDFYVGISAAGVEGTLLMVIAI